LEEAVKIDSSNPVNPIFDEPTGWERAYSSHSLPGKTNENIRKHAKASLDLANDLTHRRTAEYRLAALSAEATNAVVNIIAIISGRRDLK
jgi:hypothetical protein